MDKSSTLHVGLGVHTGTTEYDAEVAAGLITSSGADDLQGLPARWSAGRSAY